MELEEYYKSRKHMTQSESDCLWAVLATLHCVCVSSDDDDDNVFEQFL